MSSPISSLDKHLLPIYRLKQQFPFVFDLSLVPGISELFDIRSGFVYVKQKLYYKKEIYSNFLRNPQASALSAKDSLAVLSEIVELLRTAESNSDLIAIHEYRVISQNITGISPL